MKKSDKKHIFGLLALLILLMSFFYLFFDTKNKSAERYRKSENEQIYLTKKLSIEKLI